MAEKSPHGRTSTQEPSKKENSSITNDSSDSEPSLKVRDKSQPPRVNMYIAPSYAYDRVAILEAQLQKLQEKVSENASSQVRLKHLADMQDREKEEWKEGKRVLEKQLATVRQECQKLRREVDSRNGEREGAEELLSSGVLHRSLSSQSLPAKASATLWDTSSPPPRSNQPSPLPSMLGYPYRTQTKPPTSLYPASTSLLGHSLTSDSNSSLSSIRSSQSTKDHTYSQRKLPPDYTFLSHHLKTHRTPFSSSPRTSLHGKTELEKPTVKFSSNATNGYSSSSWKPHPSTSSPTSTTNSTITQALDDTDTSPDIELRRAKLKIKQLQKEVMLLEQQLTEKARSAQGHVEELVLLRTELSQEKASLAIVRQEVQDQIAQELSMARTLHARQTHELEMKMKKVERGRRTLETEGLELRTKLKGSELERSRLSEKVKELERQAEEERASHRKAMKHLQAEVKSGTANITQLESTLHQRQMELEGHLTRVEEDSSHHKTQMWHLRHQLEKVSEELQKKEGELFKQMDLATRFQQEMESTKVELQRGQTSWKIAKQELRERLEATEAARDCLLRQLAEANRKVTLHSSRVKEQQGVHIELEKYQGEVKRLEGVVKRESGERLEVEEEVERLKEEVKKMERKCLEAQTHQEQAEKRWLEERRSKEACEQEGEELRKEVERLSAELRACQHQLQEELGRRGERERAEEESLSHLQQELAKRAQQVLEMDRLLQSHQAETTARRLQLERTLTKRQGELRARTQEVENLSAQVSEGRVTMAELREELRKVKEDQRNLFSGSQAQLLAKEARLTELEKKERESEAALKGKTEEVEGLRGEVKRAEEREREWHISCEQLQSKVQTLTNENHQLRTGHLNKIQELQELHNSQLTSREEQASAHRLQLQQITQQERARQEELSRCRAQVTSLSAELSAERKVGEETKKDLAIVRAEASRYQEQVATLQRTFASLQDMALEGTPTSSSGSDTLLLPSNSVPQVASLTTTSQSSLPESTNHNRRSPPLQSPASPIPAKGNIITV